MLERKSTESIQLSGIVLIDSKGNALSQISIGDQILIQGNLTNKQNKEQPITYIIQIKDTDGNTVFLSWVKAGIQSNQQMNVAVAWTPNTSGDNSMEVFVWESMTNPIPLSAVSRIKLTVT
jgi:Flp pilus assembly protein TadG